MDTRELIRVGYIETLRQFGYTELADEFKTSTISRPVRETYKDMLGEDLDEAVLEALLAHHESVQNGSTNLIAAYEGLQKLLNGLRGDGRYLGIFTSGTVWHIRRNFKQVGMDVDKAFDAYVTADDDIRRKPHPDGVLLCLERMGDILANDAVVVGDHAADMQVGKSAKVRAVVGVSHGLGSREELQAAGADYLIDSLADLPGIITKLEQ
ncbi:MAG TPA: HAD family hydrolase [Candidatus Saccharimonadales bacterium]|nr:HAD family hydrolase [Candidatus Saccharimonadales bacterium]